MKPTPNQLALWVERHKPAWASALHLPVIASIDSVINERGPKTKRNLSAVNSLALLYLVRKNIKTGAQKGTLVDYLATFNEAPHAASMNRGPYYRRWLAKIHKARERHLTYAQQSD